MLKYIFLNRHIDSYQIFLIEELDKYTDEPVVD